VGKGKVRDVHHPGCARAERTPPERLTAHAAVLIAAAPIAGMIAQDVLRLYAA
jgi:hypothetical protein